MIDTDSDPFFEEWNIFNYVQYSKENNLLIYPDRINESGFTLFHINTKPKNIDKNDPIKIDSHVTAYWVTDDAKKIYYITEKTGDENKTLNYYNFKGNVEIATAPDISFYINSDGSIAFYTTYSDGAPTLFIIEESYKPKKIATDFSYIAYTNEDLSVVILKGNGSFYRLKYGRIFEELSELRYDEETANCHIQFIDLEGNIYYSKTEKRTLKIEDYIEDDCAVEDPKIQKPDGNDTKYWGSYRRISRDVDGDGLYTKEDEAVLSDGCIISDDGKYVLIRTSYNSLYQQELEAYEEKEQRNSFRTSIKEQTVSCDVRKLYMYNGNKTIELCDYYYYGIGDALSDSVFIYYQYDMSNIEKMKLSEVYNVDNIANSIRSRLFYPNHNINCYVATSRSNDIIYSGTLLYDVKLYGNYIYYIEKPYGDESGDLYKLTVADGKPNKAKKIATDVYAFGITEDGKIITLRDLTCIGEDPYVDCICDLYVDDEKISSDVLWYSVQSDEEGNVYYGTDYISNFGYTVMKYNGKGSVKIVEDVASYAILTPDYVYYLTNYDEDDGTYALVLHTREKEISISEYVELFNLVEVWPKKETMNFPVIHF